MNHHLLEVGCFKPFPALAPEHDSVAFFMVAVSVAALVSVTTPGTLARKSVEPRKVLQAALIGLYGDGSMLRWLLLGVVAGGLSLGTAAPAEAYGRGFGVYVGRGGVGFGYGRGVGFNRGYYGRPVGNYYRGGNFGRAYPVQYRGYGPRYVSPRFYGYGRVYPRYYGW